MNLLNSLFAIIGLITINGEPLRHQSIMIISQNGKEALSWCETDAEGQFSCSLSRKYRNEPLGIVVKLRTNDEVGVYYHPIDPKAESANINLQTTDYHELKVNLVSGVGYPEQINFFIQPEKVANLPIDAKNLINLNSENTANSYFFKAAFPNTSFSIKVKTGTYYIGGDYILDDQGLSTNPIKNYMVTAVEKLPDCTTLEGNQYIGFAVEIKEDIEVNLQLEEYTE